MTAPGICYWPNGRKERGLETVHLRFAGQQRVPQRTPRVCSHPTTSPCPHTGRVWDCSHFSPIRCRNPWLPLNTCYTRFLGCISVLQGMCTPKYSRRRDTMICGHGEVWLLNSWLIPVQVASLTFVSLLALVARFSWQPCQNCHWVFPPSSPMGLDQH